MTLIAQHTRNGHNQCIVAMVTRAVAAHLLRLVAAWASCETVSKPWVLVARQRHWRPLGWQRTRTEARYAAAPVAVWPS